MTQRNVEVRIETVNKMFNRKLTIPDYQRPYKWQTKHIKQLVDDIYSYFIKEKDKNQECRLGVIVLHKDEGKDEYNIVDGQQRLTSLFLLLYVLNGNKNPFGEPNFLNNVFNHSQSFENIKQNYEYLKSYVKDLGPGDDFKKFVRGKCTFATVILTDIDEAFQYFDSQNSRGKSLEAYDLLKAYHLRHMQGESNLKINTTVAEWEHAVTHPISLKLIMNDILYRHRRWKKFQHAERFIKDNINTFQGLNKDEQKNYPNRAFGQAQHKDMAMTFIDGDGFFEYIFYYRCLYDELFGDNGKVNNDEICMAIKDDEDKPLFKTLQANTGRVGDFYLFTLFRIMVMAYYDKFGDYELEQAVKKIAQWVYCLRLSQIRISFAAIENYAMKDFGYKDIEQTELNSLYHTICLAQRADEILNFRIAKVEHRFKGDIEYLRPLLKDFTSN